MKTIEHGNAYHMIACPKCLCVIEYTDSEVGQVYRPSASSWSLLEGHRVIICPECNQEINV